jgi:hypothetical protein
MRHIPIAGWLALGVLLACGPVGPLPGGRLSGTPTAPPADWSAVDTAGNVQLETRPEDPYSVNIWGVGVGRQYFVASGEGGESRWAQHIGADPRVRLRIGDALYELRASRIEEEAEIERAIEALERKYDAEIDAERRARGWLFRLEPRA